MKDRIKYIAAFDIDANKVENRSNILSSANKINYIIDTLNNIGYPVDIISTGQTMNRKCYRGKRLNWGNNTIKYLPTTWRGGLLLKLINAVLMNISMLFYLLIKVKKNDKVIVYHSYGTMWVYPIIKLKRANLYIECEEIYGDIFNKRWMSWLEKKSLRYGDAFIYPTKLLNEVVNSRGKPYIVVHGAYRDLGEKYFSDNNEEKISFSPDLYHVAYTGILDQKKGCLDVVKAAEFLDSSYSIHILGFGSDEQIRCLNETIERVNGSTDCHISYDGLRRGKDYSVYLSNINLGICTLDYTQTFVNTQFPSKIISYMSAGVPVLCSETPAVLTCEVANSLEFYRGTQPRDIANGIVRAKKCSQKDPRKVLDECDKKFKNQILDLLKG